jgi:hypothetical protein
LQQVFDDFPEHHMKILSGDFSAKGERENIFKQTMKNESLHQVGKDNIIKIINFTTSKNLVVKA